MWGPKLASALKEVIPNEDQQQKKRSKVLYRYQLPGCAPVVVEW
jgi:hypothetical protein